MVTIYTTETCPKCKVLKAKLEQKGIEYCETNDVNILEQKGIISVPVLAVDDNYMLFKEAIDWINGR
jgi:glutaredoxin